MPPTSTEDTIIGSRPNSTGTALFQDSVNDASDGGTDDTLFERCRSMFRQVGRRLSSFELSRQIYG
jgi:hypothetical protein